MAAIKSSSRSSPRNSDTFLIFGTGSWKRVEELSTIRMVGYIKHQRCNFCSQAKPALVSSTATFLATLRTRKTSIPTIKRFFCVSSQIKGSVKDHKILANFHQFPTRCLPFSVPQSLPPRMECQGLFWKIFRTSARSQTTCRIQLKLTKIKSVLSI